MAAAGAQLPPWDRNNVEEGQLVQGSIYADLLLTSRVTLTEHLRLDDVWPRLRELYVLNRIKEETLKYNKTGPQRVMALLDFIGQGPRWHFHGLMKALSQTNQANLIPTGGLHVGVYSDGDTTPSGLITQQLPLSADGGTRPALPPWDRSSPEEAVLISASPYADLINKSRVSLSKHLKLDNIWPILLELHVLSKTDKARLTHNNPEPDRVLALLDFIESGPKWRYHALLRAMVHTNQADLIPQGGLDTAVYTEGVVQEKTLLNTPLLPSLPKGIWDHCQHCRTALMKAHIFSFDGDKGDDLIDVSKCLVAVRLNLLSANGVAVPIKGEDILHKLDESSAPHTIRIYGDPGDGKTTFGKDFVFKWSTNFLHQIVNQGGTLSLKSKCEWTTMVFLRARDVTTTVEAAIRAQLGCKKEDEDEMMAHIRQGRGIVLVVDAFDELRDPAAIEKLTRYVQECQRRGGPTIIITCRTDLCNINAQYFDRFLTLEGYTDEEGLQYVQLYTALCQVPQIVQPSQCHPVCKYVTHHRHKLKAVLSNPLRLHIFCALATTGELNLDEQEEFNISKLLGPLERVLLKRAGVEVNKEQSNNFYRLCMHLLLKDLREFPEDLLRRFKIVPAYKIFLVQSDKRDQYGILQAFFSFKHEMLLEYFISQYIYTLSTNKRMSILLAICCNHYLRNVQKMVFQCLLQDHDTQSKLLQTMIRSILILQYDYLKWRKKSRGEDIRKRFSHKFSRVFQRSKSIIHDLKNLGDKIKTNFSLDMMDSETNRMKNVNPIYKKIDDAFDLHSVKLTDSHWLGCIKENGTFDHIVQLLQACPPDLRNSLVQNTIHCLMPADYADDYGNISYIYPTDDMRWAEVKSRDNALSVVAWCPADAQDALVQHTMKHPWPQGKLLIRTEHDDNHSGLWGKLDDDQLSMEGLWSWLLLKTTQVTHRHDAGVLEIALRVKQGQMGMNCTQERVSIHAPLTFPLTDLLSCVQANTVDLSQRKKIVVEGGTAELEDLVTCLSRCLQVGTNLQLQNVHITLPEGMPVQLEPDVATTLPDTPRVVLENWTNQQMWVSLSDTTPVTSLLSHLLVLSVRVSQCEVIVVKGGTAKLADLVTGMSRCSQVGLNVELQNTQIVLPDGLPTQVEINGTITMKDALQVELKTWSKRPMHLSTPELRDTHIVLPQKLKTPSESDITAVLLAKKPKTQAEAETTPLMLAQNQKTLAEADVNQVLLAQKPKSQAEADITPVLLEQKPKSHAEADTTPVLRHGLHIKHPKSTQEKICLSVPDTTLVTAVLPGLLDHAKHLRQCAMISVEGGTAELGHLVNCVSKCRRKGLNLHLRNIEIQTERQGSVTDHTLAHKYSPRLNLQIFDQTSMKLILSPSTHVDGVVSGLPDHVVHLSQCEKIVVEGGTAELDALVACVSKCREAGLNLILQHSLLVLPERLRTQAEENIIPGLKDVLEVRLQEWRKDLLLVAATVTTPLTGFLLLLHDHAEHLPQCRVDGGTAELGDLVTCVSKFAQVGMQLVLSETHIILPEKPKIQSLSALATLLSCLSEDPVHWSQCGEVVVDGGTAELEDLMTCVSRCRKQGLDLQVMNTNILQIDHHPGTGRATDNNGDNESLLKLDMFNQTEMKMVVPEAATKIEGLLSSLLDHAEPLSQCEMVVVQGGTAELEQVLTCIPKCREAGLNLILQHSLLVLPERLRTQGEENITKGLKDALEVRLREWRKDLLLIAAPVTTPLTGFLLLLHDHAEHLPQCRVDGGTAELLDLVICVSECARVGLKVELDCTQIVISEEHAYNTPVQADIPHGTVELTTDCMLVQLHKTAPVTALLSSLSHCGKQLSQCGVIRIQGGTAELEALVTCVSRCTDVGFKLQLFDMCIVLEQKPKSQAEADIISVLLPQEPKTPVEADGTPVLQAQSLKSSAEADVTPVLLAQKPKSEAEADTSPLLLVQKLKSEAEPDTNPVLLVQNLKTPAKADVTPVLLAQRLKSQTEADTTPVLLAQKPKSEDDADTIPVLLAQKTKSEDDADTTPVLLAQKLKSEDDADTTPVLLAQKLKSQAIPDITPVLLAQKLKSQAEPDITPVLLPQNLKTPAEPGTTPVLQKWTREKICLSVPGTTLVTAVMTDLLDHAEHLSQCENISVEGGTAELEDLVTCVSMCSQAGLKLEFWDTTVVVPVSLEVDVEKLVGLKSSLVLKGLIERTEWVTETREEYVWPSLPHLFNITHL